MNETNLDQIKTTARALLYLEPEPVLAVPTLVSHPFFSSQFFPYEENNETIFLDILKMEDFTKARGLLSEEIDTAESVFKILMLINVPYYPAFLKYTYNDMNLQDMSKVLRMVWTETEFPNHDANLSKTEFIKLFKAADKKILMDKQEFNLFSQFPKTVKVYRGTKSEDYKALSWTLNKQKAVWFSERFLTGNEKGAVYEAEIDRDYILAYFNGRNEKEVVLDYKKLKNIDKIK